jgi:hypothetical protein
MKAWIQTAIIAVMFFAAHSGALADEAKPGDKVAAKWSDGGHYLATVTAADGAQYEVLYDDGEKATVGAADLIRVRRDANFAVGDHVLAAWKSATMFPGTVTAKTEFTVTVKWDDGDAPLEVARDRVVALPREAAANAPAGAFAAGTSVAAKWAGDSYYIATVTGFTDGGKYRVAYGDGDEGDVAATDMFRVDADRGIAVGARVLACWSGARMYPGTVTGRTQNNYTVKWDDGSAPSEVPREKIAPLPTR